MLKRLKQMLVNWLLSDVTVEELRVINLRIGQHSVRIYPDHIDVNGGILIYANYIDGRGTAVIKNINGLQVPVGTNKYVP